MKNLDNVRLRMKMKEFAIIFVFLYLVAIPPAGAQLVIDSFDGPVTQNEINSFRSFVQTLTPPSSNSGNAWSQGGGGEQGRAMGLVYEATGDVGILDQEIRFCDAVLSERNDLAPAPTGQHVIWTGRIDPVWPNSFGTTIGTGGEQGYVGGHLANCARHILQTPSIWSTTVPIGDPHGFGSTYLARGKTFLAGIDAAIDGHILKSELNLSDHNHYHFASGDPYKGGLPVPWNQTMMFNYMFSNLAWAHQLLGDNPARVAQYDAIVQANLDWFFTTGSTSYTDKAGNTAYNWAYTLPNTTGEDAEEGQWDVDGFYRLWVSGRYQFPTSKMTPFANTFVDVMTLGPNSYAGHVDGTSSSGHGAHTTTIHQGWLLLADLRPDAYHSMMAADLPSSGSTGSIQTYNRFLWVKNRRFQNTQTPDFSISSSPASQTVTAGGSATYTVTVSPIHNFTGTVNLAISGLPSGATATFSSTSITGSGSSMLTLATTSSTPQGTYTLTISGSSGTLAHSTTVTLIVNPILQPDFSISAAPSSQNVTAGGSTSYTVTITAINGFSGNVMLSVTGAPAAASGSFNPNAVSGSGNSVLTVTTSSSTPSGTSTLTITGTSGTISHSITVGLTVTQTSVCTTATANGTWNNNAFPSHSGTFTAAFDATPSVSGQSSAVGISHGAQSAITGFANIVAFSTAGVIQVRNGGSYFNSTVHFSGGNSYHFRLVINVTNHTYMVFVTPPGGSEIQIGTSFNFRSEQNTVTSLDHWGVLVNTSSSGTLSVCNFTAQ